MKYIFLFVNPSSGGNRASIFTELGIKEIIFHKPEVCHIFIYDILDGEKGKKPGFLKLSSIIKNVQKKNGSRELIYESKSKNQKNPDIPLDLPLMKTCVNDGVVQTLIKTYEVKDEKNRESYDLKSSPSSATEELSINKSKEDKQIKKKATELETEIIAEKIIINDKTTEKKKTDGKKDGGVSVEMEIQKEKISEEEPGPLVKISEQNKTFSSENKTVNNSKGEKAKAYYIYVLVAGGDGTINWVLKESEQYDFNNDDFAIGVIPFGTGNDFARAFGWKRMEVTLSHVHLIQILKKIVEHVFKAELEKHDYWNVNVVLKNEGYFNKINSKTKKKETLQKNSENIKVLNLYMSNYFSIGIDSRIGRGFERHRKKNAICNKMIYALEGFKKITFKKNIPVNLIIDKMVTGNKFEEVVFTTNSSISNSHSYPLLKNAMSIVCLNIPSFSSGNDIWRHTHKIGLKLPNNMSNEDKGNYEQLKQSQQEIGDEMLEFVIYHSGIDLGLEFTLKGRAYRIHQGEGPWKIFFKDQKYNVYFQVDGEFYLMSLPDFICIEHYKKVNVLKNIL